MMTSYTVWHTCTVVHVLTQRHQAHTQEVIVKVKVMERNKAAYVYMYIPTFLIHWLNSYKRNYMVDNLPAKV